MQIGLLVLVLVSYSNGKNLTTLVSDYVEECPCLEVAQDAIATSSEIVVEDCWIRCLENLNCFAFKFCDVSKMCSLLGPLGVGFDLKSATDGICESNSDTSTITKLDRFYLLKRKNQGLTLDCEDIKRQDPLVVDGYFQIFIRGIEIPVYCLMTDSPAKTYLDIQGSSGWKRSAVDYMLPQFDVTRTWQRVQLKVDKCLPYLVMEDSTFSSMYPEVTTSAAVLYDSFHHAMAFGRSGTVGYDEYANSAVNISMTKFVFPANVNPIVKGWNAWGHTSVDGARQHIVCSSVGWAGFCEMVHQTHNTKLDILPMLLSVR